MAFFDQLNENLIEFISEQKIFFTGSAPNEGLINVSPKGLDCFRCFDEHTVGYLDLTGSGNETAAHIHENGRMTIMFCSFTEHALILRLYGRGEIIHRYSENWENYAEHFPKLAGERQIILLHIEKVQTSCGYAIPFMEFKSERSQLTDSWNSRGKAETEIYQRKKNQESLDGLPTYLFNDE